MLVLALVCGCVSLAQADPAPRVFDEARLANLLEQIRAFHEALTRGFDDSTFELIERLPGLWRELERLERQVQRSLPALRERLEAIERELRGWRLPPPSSPRGATIEV